jgi:hypothetical protein
MLPCAIIFKLSLIATPIVLSPTSSPIALKFYSFYYPFK